MTYTKAEVAKLRDDRIKAANAAHAKFLRDQVRNKKTVSQYVAFINREAK